MPVFKQTGRGCGSGRVKVGAPHEMRPSLQRGGWRVQVGGSLGKVRGTVALLEHTCGRAAKEGGWEIKGKPENHRSPPTCTSPLGLQCQAFERERLTLTRSRATDSVSL